MLPSKQLRAARKLIEDKDNWITEMFATDKQWNEIDPSDVDACRFCAEGALMHICGYDRGSLFFIAEVFQILTLAAKKRILEFRDNSDPLGYNLVAEKVRWNGPIVAINDELSHEDVLKMYDYAIQIAEEQEYAQAQNDATEGGIRICL